MLRVCDVFVRFYVVCCLFGEVVGCVWIGGGCVLFYVWSFLWWFIFVWCVGKSSLVWFVLVVVGSVLCGLLGNVVCGVCFGCCVFIFGWCF